MAEKILIIENEESTLQIFIQFLHTLNIKYQILHNFTKDTVLKDKSNIKAIFINVELNFIDLKKFMQEFLQPDLKTSIPIFFLYSRQFNKSFLAAKRFPHEGEIKKPVKAEDLLEVLKCCFDLEKQIEYPEKVFRDKLKGFQEYESKTEELIGKLEAYFE